MAPVLRVLADGRERSMRELRAAVAERAALTPEDLAATVPSGASLLSGRLHRAITYLYRSGLVRRPRRGVVQITARGQQVLAEHPGRVDLGVLGQFKESAGFEDGPQRRSQSGPGPEGSEAAPSETPGAAAGEPSATAAPQPEAARFDAADMVARAAQGDRGAWDQLVGHYDRLIRAITRDFKLSGSEATDVSQATWLRLVEHIGQLDQPERVGSWLAATTRNECLRSLGGE